MNNAFGVSHKARPLTNSENILNCPFPAHALFVASIETNLLRIPVHSHRVPGRTFRPRGGCRHPQEGDERFRSRRKGDHRRTSPQGNRPTTRDRRNLQDLLRQGPDLRAEEGTRGQIRGCDRGADDAAAPVLRQRAARRRRGHGDRRGGHHRDPVHSVELRHQDDKPVLREQ
jgi:hypothetical protein